MPTLITSNRCLQKIGCSHQEAKAAMVSTRLQQKKNVTDTPVPNVPTKIARKALLRLSLFCPACSSLDP
ncbi:hypothetical protein I7I50_09089 [Histoplasma capsulatum G186AR]|uniref:Uncharacterized protein n=1 Tax=Ajellomyces capsulatus TaxID=5037 RepID=A0A8H7YTY1_AJECA|nr:hypothetical protein I7I52_06608 [Histoplasma capsulatum]QSS74063.1 hypothetical protein I7I50_09089 [Histoplasma capsulatum G186AR]